MDRVYGRVRRVLDGDTLDVEITRRSSGNRYDYAPVERVRLVGIDAPERGSRGSRAARQQLANRVAGRGMRIDVHARDRYGRLIGKVTVTPNRR